MVTPVGNFGYHRRVRNVIGCDFNILSPEQILEMSVGEIYRFTNDASEGTLKDPVLGTIDRNFRNPVTGLISDEDPGFFGHLVLAKPCINLLFYQDLVKILNVVCWRCSNILLQVGEYEDIYRLGMRARLVELNNKRKKEPICPYCRSKQPKFKACKKDGLQIEANWHSGLAGEDGEGDKKFNTERIYQILNRISDENVALLGFDPEHNHPKNMIFTIFPIPPPAMRPSVTLENAKGPAEDDLTLFLINIIKTNADLKREIQNSKKPGANATAREINQVELYWKKLQDLIASYIDNDTNFIDHQGNNSGRQYRGIKARLNKKEGRVRGNLMGKRVNYSARSVITAAPTISLGQVGVPIDICSNLIYPEVVNRFNYKRLKALVDRGDNYPGVRWVGTVIRGKDGIPTIKQRDLRARKWAEAQGRTSVEPPLQIGNVVYRHLMAGDYVIFNRQPSLHKMSMMVHEIVPLPGKSIGIPLNATQPYGADCDGDEMNIHVLLSQRTRAEGELIKISRLIVSPQNSKPVIGLVQDSAMGVWKMGQKADQVINMSEFMELVGIMNTYNGKLVPPQIRDRASDEIPSWTIRDVLDHMFPDQLTVHDKGLNIEGGRLQVGTKLPKKAAGNGTGMLVHVCWKDLGPLRTRNFIDNMARSSNLWLYLYESHSTGISDTVISKTTRSKLSEIIDTGIKKCNDKIAQFNDGTYTETLSYVAENYGQQMEINIVSILSDIRTACEDLVVREMQSDTENRMMVMINSGSKGTASNVAQISACLGNQDINGSRVRYYLTKRALIHFPKDDYSPESLGFVRESLLEGLSPTGYVIHGMSGRSGIISRSIMTADTGYIQRKFIKTAEDTVVNYLGQVVNSNGLIIQYVYGEDGFDGSFLEEVHIPYMKMSDSLFHATYSGITANISDIWEVRDSEELIRSAIKSEFQQLCLDRQLFRKQHLSNSSDLHIMSPINWKRLLERISYDFDLKSMKRSTVSPVQLNLELNGMLDRLVIVRVGSINSIIIGRFKALVRSWINSYQICQHYRYSEEAFQFLLFEIEDQFNRSLVNPGECVGPLAAQSMGERTTQLTLSTFHHTGMAEKRGSKGVPRCKEIMNVTKKPKIPSTEVYLNDYYLYAGLGELERGSEENDEDWNVRWIAMKESMIKRATTVKNIIQYLNLGELLQKAQIIFDNEEPSLVPEDREFLALYRMVEENMGEMKITHSPWILRLEFDRAELDSHDVNMWEIERAIMRYQNNNNSEFSYHGIFSDENSDRLIGRIQLIGENISSPITLLKTLLTSLKEIKIKGIANIERCSIREVKKPYIASNGELRTINHPKFCDSILHMEYVVDTFGLNMMDLGMISEVDVDRTISNDFHEIYNLLGIEAARNSIITEFTNIMEDVNPRHMGLIADLMTSGPTILSVSRAGVKKSDSRPWARVSFETIMEQVKDASLYGEHDNMKGVSASIMMGQHFIGGTNSFQLILDEEMLVNNVLESQEEKIDYQIEGIDDLYYDIIDDQQLDMEFQIS